MIDSEPGARGAPNCRLGRIVALRRGVGAAGCGEATVSPGSSTSMFRRLAVTLTRLRGLDPRAWWAGRAGAVRR